MEWTNIRKLKTLDLLETIEEQFSIVFPCEYKDLIRQYNAGIPNRKFFSIEQTVFEIDRFISANPTDSPNIYNAMNWVQQTASSVIVPIALDTTGNMISIVFDADTYQIILISFETGNELFISNTLKEFFAILK